MAEDNILDRLKDVVGAYGSDPVRWPEAERGELETLARSCGDAHWMA
ncbi:MAG: hypothetical protein HKN60_02740, partial [Rhizobiales bacterium]|nr:hypothetical protein [Hyphomicrobiales bacterium]